MNNGSPSAPETEPLLQKASQGYRTTLVSQGVRLACKALSVVVMARLLTPADHGQFAMAASVFALIALFRDAGLGKAAVQARTLDNAQQNAVFWAYVGLGVLLAAVTWLTAPWMAHWFESPPVAGLLRLMSLAFVLIGAGGFLRIRLYREMEVPVANRLEVTAALIATAAMIGAGVAGTGAYAFAVFLLVSEGVATVLAWRVQSWRPAGSFSWVNLQSLWRTGGPIAGHEILTHMNQQLDALAIGRWFGAYSLGLYSRVSQLLSLPAQHVVGPLGQVLLAALSRLDAASPDYPTHARRTVAAIAHLVLPMFAICIALPDETVRLVLGAQWPEAAPFVRILAIGAAATAITTAAVSLNIAIGDTMRLMVAAAATLPFTIAAIWWGGRHGALGVAVGLAAVQVGLAVPRLWWLLRRSPGGLRDYLAALTGPLATMALAIAGMFAGRAWTEDGANWLLRFGAALLAAGVILSIAAVTCPPLRRQWLAALHYLPWNPARPTSGTPPQT